MYSSKNWLAGVALAFPLAASVGGGCAVFSGGNGGSGGSGGSTSVSTSSSSSSTTTSSSGTGGVGTGGAGTGGSCACTTASECPASTNPCVAATCASCTCGTMNVADGTVCGGDAGAALVCISAACVAPTCADTIKDGVETDVDCGGGGPMNCPACALGKACLVNSDCASAVCTAKVCTAPPVNHNCAGAETHALTLGGPTLTISATTAGSTEDYTSFCGDTTTPPSSPNVVYALTVPTAGALDVVLTAPTGSSLVPSLEIRATCATPDFCFSSGTSTQTFDEDVKPGTYYVIVSGQPGTSGAFTLTATLSGASCGNGVIETGEQCDPGTPAPPNDGCGAPGTANQCQFIAPTIGDTCATAQVLSVPIGTTVLPASQGMSTYGFHDDYYGSCAVPDGTKPAPDGGTTSGDSDGTGGLDRVFQVTPAASGTLTVSIGYEVDGVTSSCASSQTAVGCWAAVLYARQTCGAAAPELGCALGISGANIVPSTISFPVTANTPYWVFVDGFNSATYSYGPFNLIVNLK